MHTQSPVWPSPPPRATRSPCRLVITYMQALAFEGRGTPVLSMSGTRIQLDSVVACDLVPGSVPYTLRTDFRRPLFQSLIILGLDSTYQVNVRLACTLTAGHRRCRRLGEQRLHRISCRPSTGFFCFRRLCLVQSVALQPHPTASRHSLFLPHVSAFEETWRMRWMPPVFCRCRLCGRSSY